MFLPDGCSNKPHSIQASRSWTVESTLSFPYSWCWHVHLLRCLLNIALILTSGSLKPQARYLSHEKMRSLFLLLHFDIDICPSFDILHPSNEDSRIWILNFQLNSIHCLIDSLYNDVVILMNSTWTNALHLGKFSKLKTVKKFSTMTFSFIVTNRYFLEGLNL